MTYAAMGWPYGVGFAAPPIERGLVPGTSNFDGGAGGAELTGFGKLMGTAGSCSCALCAGNTQAQCTGGQMSSTCPDNCCGVSAFNNATYKKVKGAESWRYKNEKRVRHVLHAMLAPVGADPTGLEAYAYNSCGPGTDCGVDTAFLNRVSRAAYNYHSIYPKGRWYKKEKGVPSACASDGWYSQFRQKTTPATKERIAALENAVGSKISSAYKDRLRTKGFETNFPGAPPNVETWWRRSHKTMDSVPGSQAKRNVNEFPDNDEFMWYGGPDGTLIGGSPHGVSPWMQKFLGDFAPSIPISMTMIGLSPKAFQLLGGKKPPLHLSAVQAATLGPMIKPEDAGGREDMTPEEAKKKKLYVALGLGAVLAVGVGVWATRRRKR